MNFKFRILAILFFLPFSLNAQIKTTHLTPDKLPASIVYDGKLKDAIYFKDKRGENYALVTETGVHKINDIKHENDGLDAELFSYIFLLKDGIMSNELKIYDNVIDCPLDLEAVFLPNTLQATDLDKDGIAEIWFMSKTVCHGDVSPYNMKIIMSEEEKTCRVVGTNKVKVSDKKYVGGTYKFDDRFLAGPAAFREFAKKLWNKNIMQTWE